MKAPPAGVVLLLTTVLWGSTFVVTKSLLDVAPPLAYLALRFGAAALVFVPFVLWRGLRRTPHLLVDGLLLGSVNAIGIFLQVFGQLYTTPAKSAFITSMNTPLTALAGLALYRIVPTRAQRVAIALASAGLCLLTWPPAGAKLNPGDLLTIGCALAFAIFITEAARRAARHDALALTMIQVTVAAVMFVTAALVARALGTRLPLAEQPTFVRLEAQPFPHGSVVLWQMAYMSIGCVVVVMAVQTWALQRLSAATAAVIYSLEPVVATVLALLVDGMSAAPGPRGTAGAFLVLCGIYVAEGRDLRRLMRRSSAAPSSRNDADDGAARQPTNEQPPDDLGVQ
ncbi:MAG: DMT family transporter [Polyangia bacterium]